MNRDEVKRIAEKLMVALQKQREQRESEIVKIPLQMKHVENCRLLLNREQLLNMVKKNAVVAEIGVDEGKFSKKIHEITRPEKLHLIDIWGTDRFHDGKYKDVESFFKEDILLKRIQILKKLSTEASKEFKENYFDWIYIDTDHSYETTKAELQLYAPKMKKDGIIAGHDYRMGNWVTTYRYGVIEAVHEFCVNENWELIYLTIEPTESQSFAIRKIQ